ncbi:stage II sporulation protein M [Candidatus Woesearchaeota archaeon]|nr:stage II sporulation protein M [Candidatus Woesearchaeota archaeon]
MVFESFVKAGAHPASLKLFSLGFIAPFASATFSYLLFNPWASIAMVFLSSFVLIPAMVNIINDEEKIAEEIETENKFLDEYGHVLVGLLVMFIGLIGGYLLLFMTLPPNIQQMLFSVQQTDIHALDGMLVGEGAFLQILENNFRVLGIGIILSLFFGFGAVEIIVWNGALVATVMGNFLNEFLSTGQLAQGLFFSMTRYLTHGLPEVASYIIAGLGGSILSIAIMKHEFRTKQWWRVVKSSTQLFVISGALLIFAAIIEVYLTPWLY